MVLHFKTHSETAVIQQRGNRSWQGTQTRLRTETQEREPRVYDELILNKYAATIQ